MKPAAATVLLALAAIGCSQSKTPTGPGALSVALSAPSSSGTNPSLAQAPETVTSVLVSVTEVRAHVASLGWILLSDLPFQVDLLALPDAGVRLGLASLPAGRVTQIRLLVAATGNSVAFASGGQAPLVVPSGIESGIKIPGPWDISPCNETALALEFAGEKSVWYHPTGSGSPWILRPVIHVKRARDAPAECEGGGEDTCVPSACPSGLCDETGRCAPGGTGAGCSDDVECLSGTCEGDVCREGGPGDPCRVAGDCASGACGEDGTCDPGSAGGTGAMCNIETDCLSNACLEGFCGPGAEGAPCAVDDDCQTDLGLACVNHVCSP